MKYACLLLAMLAMAAPAQKQKKPADVTVLDAKGHRTEDKVTLDGKVRVTGDKALKGLVLEFSFLSSSGDVLTSEKADLSDDKLDKNEEPAFHAETLNPPGSIRFRIKAFDSADRELSIANGGPFTIE